MVKYLIQDVPEAIEQEISDLLPLASEQRRQEALQFKHAFGQYACLKTYRMLQELLETNDDLIFERNEHGKPYLISHPNIHFNISHCRQALLVAISDHEIGVDIEGPRKITDSLMQYSMNANEIQLINTSPTPQSTFLQLWTKKESLVKLRGTGLQGEIPNLLTHTDDILFDTHTQEKHVWTIATYK